MAQTCEMKLLGAPGSVFVTRVKFALKLKCIEYEYIEEDLRNKSELLRTSSPIIQQVPVLFHANEQPMIESLAILEYLDEIQPYVHPLLPSNPSDRAQCRNLAYTFDTQYHPWTKEFMITRDKRRKEELKKLLIEGSLMLEEAFVKLSKGKTFFGGDDIGYLDVALGSFIGWFKFNGSVFGLNVIDEARTPRLTEWVKCMWSHEVARSIIPSHEIHMDFLNMLQSQLPPMHAPVST
ncbi:glutathione S-transferase U16-like isoform X2 [Bidens hawaiensis]|uniref:glutathione S-transferase U16-like isoform X2 n=1 Tax=Bidens hawaiensis TaxID=980011 RepID=UPI004049AFE9